MSAKGIIKTLNGHKFSVDSGSLKYCILKAPTNFYDPERADAWVNDLQSLTVIHAAADGEPLSSEAIDELVATGPMLARDSGLDVVCVLKFKHTVDYLLTVRLYGEHDIDDQYGLHFKGTLYCWKTTDEEIAALVAKELR